MLTPHARGGPGTTRCRTSRAAEPVPLRRANLKEEQNNDTSFQAHPACAGTRRCDPFGQAAFAQNAKPCEAKWEEVDKNNDGKITIDEANDALKVRFNEVDTNRDGVIAPAEYEACQKA